jgi:hypothetical protein
MRVPSARRRLQRVRNRQNPKALAVSHLERYVVSGAEVNSRTSFLSLLLVVAL